VKLHLKYKDNTAIDTKTLKAALENETVVKAIFDDIKAKLKESKLNTFEKPMYVHLSSKEMTVENDCLTPTLKVRRNFAKKFYAQEIEDLYAEKKCLTTAKVI